jgi:hypothetical protein
MTDEQHVTNLEKCNVVKCNRTATHTVKIILPPNLRFPQTVGLQVYMRLCLCQSHSKAVKAKEIMNDNFRETVDAQLIMAHRAPVDYNRAKLESIPLSDEGYQNFLAKSKPESVN